MGSMVNTVSQLGLMSSAMRWDSVGGVRIRTNWMRAYGYSSAGVKRKFGFLRDSRKRIAASCFEGNKEGNSVPNKLELEPLWNDEYGTQTVQDYVEIAKEMILRPDGGPPRWFCPIECGCPLKDSPVLLYLPGIDGLGLGLILHHKALGRAFEVRCMHIPVNDRTPIEGLVSFVENAVRLENKSSGRKPIYIVGDSFGGCIALSAAARIPTIDLVVILINPATSYNRSKLQYLPPLLEAVPDQVQTFMPYLYGLTSGNPFKMAVVNTTGSSPTLIMEQVFSKLTAILPHLSDLADIISMDFYVWKLKLLKAAAAKANSHLHAVKAEVLIMASGRDYMFPSGEEAGRLVNSLQNCKMRYFKDNGHALLMAMESSSELVVFPLLATPIETNYRACTIPYRFPSDNPKKPTLTELSWINLLGNSIPSFRKRAESDDSVPDAPARAEKFAQRYSEILEDLKNDPKSHGGPPDCILLCQLREQVLRELGFRDIFKKVKDKENAKAIFLFEEVVLVNDAIEDTSKRIENLVRGILAGNIFYLGSAQLEELFSKDGMSFLASSQNLVPRPWVIDDLDAFISKWSRKSWKKAAIFVDNSGADIILGILPLARELLRCGTQVVLAANKLPSVNDVTYPELIEILSKLTDEKGMLAGVDTANLFLANSGND